ncbi:MAG: hypothetical protein JST59_09505, partial [Actinobacteria bacterium]|nr:hypothetical protein [Actinomycetota bacterium]
FQAAQKLTDAADIISTNPASLQLRYLQTLLEIGSNQNTTVVFPLPMDVLEPFIGRADHNAGGSKAKPRPPAPPGGGEPVPGVEGSGLSADPDPGPDPIVPPDPISPAEGDAPTGGGGSRPMPGVTEPEEGENPPDPDLPPSRS